MVLPREKRLVPLGQQRDWGTQLKEGGGQEPIGALGEL